MGFFQRDMRLNSSTQYRNCFHITTVDLINAIFLSYNSIIISFQKSNITTTSRTIEIESAIRCSQEDKNIIKLRNNQMKSEMTALYVQN